MGVRDPLNILVGKICKYDKNCEYDYGKLNMQITY